MERGKGLQLLSFLTVTLILQISLLSLVAANVNDEWDWNPRRNLNYSFVNGVPGEWKNWTREAAGIINAGGTGWTLQEGDIAGDHIKISFNSTIHPTTLAETNWGDRYGRNDSRLTYRNITIYNESYGTTGRTYDPVWTILHELLHTLRIRHHNATAGQSGIMNTTIRPGDHNASLSPSDLAQMRASNGSTVAVPVINVTTSGGTFSSTFTVRPIFLFGNIPPNATQGNGTLSIHSWFWDLQDSKPPFRLQLEPGVDTVIERHHVIQGLDLQPTVPIEIIALQLQSVEPFHVAYDMGEVPGQKNGTIMRPPLDPNRLKVFFHDPFFDVFRELQSQVDPQNNLIQFQVSGQQLANSLFVLAAPALAPLALGPENETATESTNATVTVSIRKFISLTLATCLPGLDFGVLSPGAKVAPIICQNDTQPAVTLTSENITNVPVNISLSGTNYKHKSGREIPVNNTKFNTVNDTSPAGILAAAVIPLFGEERASLVENAGGNESRFRYHQWLWMDVPRKFLPAGTYASTYTYEAMG